MAQEQAKVTVQYSLPPELVNRLELHVAEAKRKDREKGERRVTTQSAVVEAALTQYLNRRQPKGI